MRQYLTTREVASKLHIKPSTLWAWRRDGKGPRWSRAGTRIIRYAEEEVDNFMKERQNNEDERGGGDPPE